MGRGSRTALVIVLAGILVLTGAVFAVGEERSQILGGSAVSDGDFDLGSDTAKSDAEYQPVPVDDTASVQSHSSDPWNPAPEFFQDYALGVDHIEAWVCHVSAYDADVGLTDLLALLNGPARDWFRHYSNGLLDLKVTNGGTLGASSWEECGELVAAQTSGSAEAAVVLTSGFGNAGFAYFPCCPGHFPDNGRLVLLDAGVVDWQGAHVTIHELGHSLQWNHVDSWADIMYPHADWELRAPSALFRYRAGWIEQQDVTVFEGGTIEYDLKANLADGTQMLVIPTNAEYRFVSIAARVHNEVFDHLEYLNDDLTTTIRNGVEVLVSDYYCDYETGSCNIRWSPTPIKDGIVDVGDTIFLGDAGNYESPDFGDPPFRGVPVTIEVLSVSGNTVRVRLDGTVPELTYTLPEYPPPPSGGTSGMFVDDDKSTFESDIEWLAETGITKGCNPPMNDRYCPDDFVTRGQMAAFLHRALNDVLTATQVVKFTDDDGNTFEADIEWLGATGVTKGCNPPTNSRYCPNDFVTRGQMAAFLVRALGYTDDGGGDLFIDDNGDTFEHDIDRLGTAGVTRGCNPPVNDRYCPNDFVTRGQMAAFLHRALGG